MGGKPVPGRSLWLEMLMPWVFALAGVVIGIKVHWLWLLNASWKNSMLDKVVAACAIFVAYLGAAVTIFPAVEDKAIFKRLKSWGYYRYLVKYLSEAIWSSVALLGLSLLAVPLPPDWSSHPGVDKIFSSVWWGVLFFTIGAAVRALRILIKSLLAH